MTIEDIVTGIGDYTATIALVQKAKGDAATATAALAVKQYEVKGHDINDTAKRQDKIYTDDKGAPGQALVARLAVPMQKQIVNRAATFLCGNPITLTSTPTEDKQKALLAAVQKVWKANKLDYKSKGIAKLMMAETEAAELWYVEALAPNELTYWDGILSNTAKFKLRVRILAISLGDSLYPVYSPAGDLIAFGRGYNVVLTGSAIEEHFDLYTADNSYTGVKDQGGWTVTTLANPYKKIPVIYYSQPLAEWADVQSLIDRFEKQISNLADTNDYFGSPMAIVKGEVEGYSQKGETGKIMKVSEGGDIKYLTWDQAPASVKLELDTLDRLISQYTDTPVLNLDSMQGLGAYSVIALKMFFLSAHMKASDKEEIFGESIQRRINYLQSVIGVLDLSFAAVQLDIKPKFEYFLPKNVTEVLENITAAVMAKILSVESAVALNPLVTDAVAELIKLKAEADSAGALDALMNQPN